MKESRGGQAIWQLAGLVAAAVLYGACSALGLPQKQALTAGVAGLCATYWVTQAVPIPVTSLMPFALFPLLGVLSQAEVSKSYGHPLVLLLMAGFMLSMAIEASGAHRRLALSLARIVSGGGAITAPRLLLGFMIASAGASMWISNTATALILLPIALAASEKDQTGLLRPRLLIGVAYASSIGGLGTPIGTPPNLLFMATLEELGGEAWSFSHWMTFGLPVVVLMLPLAYFVLVGPLRKARVAELPEVGPITPREVKVLWIFSLTALAWIIRVEPWGGWTGWLGLEGVDDTTVAFMGLLAVLLIPTGDGQALLSWKDAERIPWGILMLFGGGIALASGFSASGLSESIGSSLSALAGAPELAMIFGIALVVTFLTEVTSNTATTALLMPILGATAQAAGILPAKLMLPAAISASCAFMLPVATAPNAIMFGSGHIDPRMMARTGFVLNLAGAFVVTAVCYLLL